LSPEVSDALLAEDASAPEAQDLEIMPENWGALRVFLGLETQWRRAGVAGVPTGLDYAAIPVVCSMLGVLADADLLARLRVIEGAALAALAERR
jgi:hypothetical protein